MLKEEKLLLRSNFSFFPQYFLHVVRFSCLGRDQIFIRDKRLFEISEFEIARVNCIFIFPGTIEPILVSWKTVSLEFVLGCVCSAANYIAALGRASIKPKLRLSLYHVFFVFKDNLCILYLLHCYHIKSVRLVLSITKTYLYNFDPLKPNFYIVKLGFTGVYIIFLIFAENIDCGYSLEPPRRGGSNEYPQSMF